MNRSSWRSGLAASIAALLLTAEAGAQQPDGAVRLRLTMNDGWRFAAGDVPNAAAPALADSAWTPVTLPHSWNAEDAYTRTPGYRRGIGWYRRRLTVDPALRGRRLFLYFEGANQVAKLFVNGEPVGTHVGGYTAFAFDISDRLTPGETALIAVRVDNRHDPDIPPLDADFTFYGGIYRDVWLIATAPVHVTVTDHASPGVYIDTPGIRRGAPRVEVRGTIVNAGASAARVEIINRVLDPGGREVARLRTALRIPRRGSAPFRSVSRPIPDPLLWSPDAPHLYTVITEVRSGGTTVDRIDNPLGFRWFDADAQRGFSLNGKPLRLYGTNRHQDRAGMGNAVPDWVHREDVRLVKEMGFNFLRLAHYPQDPVVLAETDRRGLLVWEEIPVVNRITMSDAFDRHAEQMLIEMIRQHYNHPSVMWWGYMNEVMLQKPRPVPDGYYERITALARRLDRRAKMEDSSRATVTAISFDEIDNGTGFQDIPEILGLNLYFGWYYRSLESFGAWLDSLHARHPTRPIVISEYGAGSDERIHTLEPRPFDFSTEWQQRFHELTFPQLEARDWVIATAVWNQFDFGAKNRHDSKPNINQKGLFYYDRTPKDIAAYYEAALLDQPVLHVATRDWARRAGSAPSDRRQPVTVYSNLDRVELFLNDSSLGERRIVNRRAAWEVPLVDGANSLRANGVGQQRGVTDAAVVHYTDRSHLFAGGGAGGRPGGARMIAVNAGSHYHYVAPGGLVHEADRPYERGRWGHEGGEPVLIHHRIYQTGEDALFQAAREGVRLYRFDVPDGRYEVRVGVAETRHERPGERIFSIRVNGQPLFTDLDLVATAGRYTAVERAIESVASGGDGIVLQFDGRAGRSTISSIVVRRLH